MAEFNTRIKLKRDTSANWTSNDPVLLDGEIIIVDTASGGVRLKIGDGTKKYSQLPFDDESILTAIAEKSDMSETATATLSASSWSNAQQTITVTGLGATQNGVIGLPQSVTADQLTAAIAARLYICGQAAGSVTIAANGTVPEIDIPVSVILLG